MDIDRLTAEETAALLSTSIAELLEGAHPDAVIMIPGNLPAMIDRARRLRLVGLDLAILADALVVIARRALAEDAG